MNFFHHKDLGNHLLQLYPEVVKHPVYVCAGINGDLLTSLYALPLRLTPFSNRFRTYSPVTTFMHVALLFDLGCYHAARCVNEKLWCRGHTHTHTHTEVAWRDTRKSDVTGRA